MATIKIDNKEYDTESLSAEAKASLGSISFVDNELARLQAKTAALQTARMAYMAELQKQLALSGDTVKLN